MRKFIKIFMLMAAFSAFNGSIRAENPENIFKKAVFHYFNGEHEKSLQEFSKIKFDDLTADNPLLTVIYEYRARAYFEIIKKTQNIKGTNYKENADINVLLEQNFFTNIDDAIKISRSRYDKLPTPENAYNLAMALSVKSAFVAQLYGKSRIKETGQLMDMAVKLANFCLKRQNPYCLAYFPIGATQYLMAQKMGAVEKFVFKHFLSNVVPNLHGTINFDKEEALNFMETSSRCQGPDFRREEILLALQGFLMEPEDNQKKRYKYNLMVLPILQKLAQKYPNNAGVQKNFKIVTIYFNIRNK